LHVARVGETIAYKILVTKSECKESLGRPRLTWEDNIKMWIKETMFEDVDWIHLAQDWVQWQAHMNTIMNLRTS